VTEEENEKSADLWQMAAAIDVKREPLKKFDVLRAYRDAAGELDYLLVLSVDDVQTLLSQAWTRAMEQFGDFQAEQECYDWVLPGEMENPYQ